MDTKVKPSLLPDHDSSVIYTEPSTIYKKVSGELRQIQRFITLFSLNRLSSF